MYTSKWTPEKGSGHLFRPDLLVIPSSSVIFGVSVYGEQKTPPHAHADSDEWFLVVEGKGDIETDGVSNIVTPGCIVYTPQYAWHAFQGIGGHFRILFGIYGWRSYIHPRENEKVEPVKGRKSMVLSLMEARAEAQHGKLSIALLEPRNVLRNNCLGVNYCMFAPGASVAAHAHDRLEQVTYVTSGTADVQVGEEERRLSKDEAIYIPLHLVHSLENHSGEPVATVNCYYACRRLWEGNIEAFLTEIDQNADSAQLRYPSEI
ncbi:MAG: cupin domain-containing protein [Candidatus Bathyarchaeota archaeon]|nr:cupin domain-containing protein [Candidatus Bathyarchaeota archaeon]MDH5688507.1 cupin domain-containing protein [Candidatus Bathyarchaeota archaeon]